MRKEYASIPRWSGSNCRDGRPEGESSVSLVPLFFFFFDGRCTKNAKTYLNCEPIAHTPTSGPPLRIGHVWSWLRVVVSRSAGRHPLIETDHECHGENWRRRTWLHSPTGIPPRLWSTSFIRKRRGHVRRDSAPFAYTRGAGIHVSRDRERTCLDRGVTFSPRRRNAGDRSANRAT